MKKLLSVLLIAVLILTAAACGKKEESTEAPSTTQETPAPATEPQTTLPETTVPPETTQAAPKTDPSAKAQDIWEAAVKDLESLLKSVDGADAESRIFTFNGAGTIAMTVSISLGGQAMDIPIKLTAEARGEGDSKKGAHAVVLYDAELSSLGSLVSLIGMNEEALKGEAEAYLDLESARAYFLTKPGEGWQYTELGEREALTPDDFSIEAPALDELFEDYEMAVTDEEYRIKGRLKKALPEAALSQGEMPEDIIEMTGTPFAGIVGGLMQDIPLEDLAITAELTIDVEKRLSGIDISADEFEMDLSNIFSGLGAKLDKAHINVSLKHDEGGYELPEKIKKEARQAEHIGGAGWADEVFVLKDELLADNDKLSVTLKEITTDAAHNWDIVMLLEVENKTKKPITVQIGDIVVDGYLTDEFGLLEIEAGEKLEEAVSISAAALRRIGVKTLDELAFHVEAYDSDDFGTEKGHLDEEFVFSPNGSEDWEVPSRLEQENELVLYEKEGVKAVLLGFEENEYFGLSALCYLENFSGKELAFTFTDVSFNGKAADNVFWETDLKNGLRSYYEQVFSSLLLEDVESLETVSFTFGIYDAEKWWGEPLFEDEFTFNMK